MKKRQHGSIQGNQARDNLGEDITWGVVAEIVSHGVFKQRLRNYLREESGAKASKSCHYMTSTENKN